MTRRIVSTLLSSRWAFLSVLIVGLATTAVVAAQLRREANDRDRLRFQNASQRLEDAINQRIEGYLGVMRAAAGMIGSEQGKTSVAEFHAFVSRLKLSEQYPGARGIGFTQRVARRDLDRVTAEVRQTRPSFTPRPESERSEWHPIVLIEPMDQRNTDALGFDMFTETRRRATMEAARDSGGAESTDRIVLIQDEPTAEPAFIIYVPVYSGAESPQTKQERRDRLIGFVFVPFRATDLFRSVFPTTPTEAAFTVHVGTELRPESLLFQSSPPDTQVDLSRFHHTEILTVAGRQWTLTSHSTPAFERLSGWNLPTAALLSGILLTLLLTGLTALQTRARLIAEQERAATAAAEAALRTAVARLELVFQGARVGLWYSSLPFEKLEWDERVKAHFFMRADETDITVEKAFERIYPDDRERIRAAMGWSIREHAPFDVEYRTVSLDGTRMNWIRSIGQTFVDENGNPVRFDVLTVDVTALKEAQEALAESEAKFRQLANSMSQLAWIARPDGWIIWYNQRWYDYIGATEADAPGWAWVKMLGDEGDPDLIARAKLQIAAGEPLELTHSLKPLGGEPGWFLTRAVPLRDAGGHLLFWFGTSTDVSEQRKLSQEREQLLESERTARGTAERASRIKDEFLATLSHELRTPLNAILGWSQILRRQFADNAPLLEGLSVIERNTRVQTQLVSDLLDMSRVISGKLRIEAEVVDPPAIIVSAVESVRFAADSKEIVLATDLDPHAGPIYGDPARLQQVVWNLLSNAIKFTRPGGEVRVRLRRLRSSVRIEVSDNGEGIDLDFLPHMFERFRQADASTTRRHGGLGLGLAIVKNLVELHGGKVWVASDGPGSGSNFFVELPILSGALQGGLAETSPAPSAETIREVLTGLCVLVVDDEPDAREMIRRILIEAGAEVLTAAGGREGLDLICRRRPDVIVSDIGMPEQDGYQFIRAVRNGATACADTPAAAVTAFARPEDRVAALNAGYQNHIAKPVDSTELVAVVAALAGRAAKQNGLAESTLPGGDGPLRQERPEGSTPGNGSARTAAGGRAHAN